MPSPDLASLKLKDPLRIQDHRRKSQRGAVDTKDIVRGKALFTIDVTLPNMQFAVFQKCPVWGGKVKSANVDEIKKMQGIKDAFVIDRPASAGNPCR